MIKMQASRKTVLKVLDGYKHGHSVLSTKGIGNLTFTGGKIHELGGGWWAISGYRSDNQDRDRVVQAIQNLKAGLPK